MSEPDRGEGVQKQVWEALDGVNDPELHMSVTTLGLVYGIQVQDGNVEIEMTLTTPACPYGPQLLYAIEYGARQVEGVKEVSINLVWDPPWGPDSMTEEAKLELGFDI